MTHSFFYQEFEQQGRQGAQELLGKACIESFLNGFYRSSFFYGLLLAEFICDLFKHSDRFVHPPRIIFSSISWSLVASRFFIQKFFQKLGYIFYKILMGFGEEFLLHLSNGQSFSSRIVLYIICNFMLPPILNTFL